jgi:hypothetical protein
MVKTSLVESDLSAGRHLVREVRAAPNRESFRVKAVFWLYYPESQEWRLVIATPLVDEEGPLATYAQLRKVLDRSALHSTGLSLQNVAVMSPGDPMVKAIRALASKTRYSPGPPDPVRLARGTVSGTYVEDAYVYALRS